MRHSFPTVEVPPGQVYVLERCECGLERRHYANGGTKYLNGGQGYSCSRHVQMDSVSVPGLLEPLTGKQLDIVRMSAEGMPQKAIARELGCALSWVSFHAHEVIRKTGRSNLTAAVVFLLRAGAIK